MSRSDEHIITLIISVLLCTPAKAQSSTAAADLFIEEVIVTAQRREQSLQKVPVAVSNLSAQLLRDSGATDLLDIQMLVPSLSMEQNKGPGFATFRIRGIGNLGNIPNFEPAVGLFVDGAYRSRSGLGVQELLDVERVEVLRGPQSTLYGRNVTGGLVNVITQRPTKEFEGYLEGSAASLDELIVNGSLSGPIGEDLQGRISAMTKSRSGSFDDAFQQIDTNDENMTTVRGQLAFQPSERLSILAIAGYVDRSIDCCAPDVDMGQLSTLLSTVVTAGQFEIDNDPTNRVIQQNETYTYDIDAWEAMLTIDYEFGAFFLTSLTSYDEYDIFSVIDAEQTLLDLAVFNDKQVADTFTQEIRLTSNSGGSIDWMFGASYYRNDFTRGSLDADDPLLVLGAHWPLVAGTAPGAPGDSASFQSSNDTENFSIFYQGNWHVSERFVLGAGIRWFEEQKTIDINSAASAATLPSFVLAFGVQAPVSASHKTDQVVWNLSAQYQVSDNNMLYATASRGAKGGGMNGDWGPLTIAQREFDDEEVVSYEVGVKSALADRRLTLNANVFHSSFDDFQNATFLGTSFLIDNANEVTTRGLELDMVALLSEWLMIDLSYTYLDAQYDSFTNGPCVFPLVGNCDLSGESLPFTAKNRWHIGLLGSWGSGSGEIYARADYAFVDATNNDSGLDPRSEQSGYGLLNGRIGWRSELWDVAVWVTNATDEVVVALAAPQTLFGGLDGGRQLFLNDPKSYGVTLRYNF